MDDKKNVKKGYDTSRLLIAPTTTPNSTNDPNSQSQSAQTQNSQLSAASSSQLPAALSISTNIQRLGSLRHSPTTGDLIPKDEKKATTPRFVPKVPTARKAKTPTEDVNSQASTASQSQRPQNSQPSTQPKRAAGLAYIPKPRSQSSQNQRTPNLPNSGTSAPNKPGSVAPLDNQGDEFWNKKKAEEEWKKKEIIEKQRNLFEGASNPPMILPAIDEVQKIEGDEFEIDEEMLNFDEEIDENGEVKEESINPESPKKEEKSEKMDIEEEKEVKTERKVFKNKDEEEEEIAALKDSIFKYNIEKLNSEDQMFFVQLPSFLPFGSSAAGSSETKKKQPVSMESALSSFSSMESNLSSAPQGKIGELLVHKSGKVKMKFGDVYFDVMPGSDFKIAENVMAVFAENKKGFILGEIANRICCVPDVDKLLNNDEEN